MGSLGNLLVTPEMLRQSWKVRREAEAAQVLKDLDRKATDKIDTYKNEQKRRKAAPFGGLTPSTGTLEGALGFEDR